MPNLKRCAHRLMKIKCVLFLLLSCFMCVGKIEATPIASQNSYKGHSDEDLEKYTEETLVLLSQAKGESRSHFLNIHSIFYGHILKHQPEYFGKLVVRFPTTDWLYKIMIFKAMKYAGIDEKSLDQIEEKSLLNQSKKVFKTVDISTRFNLETMSTLDIRSSYDVDYLWFSFLATGDQAYISSILNVLNPNDESLLMLAYEWINREYLALNTDSILSGLSKPMTSSQKADWNKEKKTYWEDKVDLFQIIKEKCKENPSFANELEIIIHAFRTLENSGTDESRRVAQCLIQEDLKLDYWAKIKNSL